MKKVMFIGESHSGKSSLIQYLSGKTVTSHRPMAVEYFGQFVNTPGEFLENPWFYSALITTSAECDILAMVQDATRRVCLFPPQFGSMFNRDVVGIITNTAAEEANVERAQRFLQFAGIANSFCVDMHSGAGLAELREVLL